MPRIDPRTLLNCLHSLLNEQGGILGSNEVKRFVVLMSKYSNTLVSKICYILILKATDNDLLVEFMAEGGWELVFQWLGTAITHSNNPFIKEILHLLIKCPIKLERLKESNSPRTVKGLSKDSEDAGVRDLARQLVEMWLDFIKSGKAAVEPLPVAVPLHVAPPTPAATSTPSPIIVTPTSESSQPSFSPVQPFKIIVRDGKRVLMSVGTDESTPPKVKKIDKTSEPSSNSKVKEEPKKLSENNSDLVAMKAAITKSIAKSESKDQEETKKTELSPKDKKERREYKEHSKNSSSSHKAHKSSSNDKVRESSKDKSKDVSKDRSKDSEKRKESREKSKESKSRVSDKDNHRKSTNEKDTSAVDDLPPKSLMPAISSLGKIPKKTSSTNIISAAEAASGGVLGSGKRETIPLPVAKKGTYSDERKRSAELKPSERPKTVKTLPTKFRSTGLEEDVKPPPSRLDVKKKEHAKDVPKRPSSSSKEDKDGAVPSEKKIKTESHVIDIKEKIDKLYEKPSGIKLIPPKPKPVIVESDMFIDALKASASKDQKKKKRRSSSSSSNNPSGSSKEGEIKKEPGESSPKSSKSSSPPKETSPVRETKPLKFYRDTLDEPLVEPAIKEIKEESSSQSPKPKLFPEGVLVVHRSRRAPKKSVRWRTEADLVSIQFFELDETERVNVSRPNFVDMKAMERNRERETFLLHKMGSEDSGTSKMSWGPLFIVDVPPDKQPPEGGLHSTEKAVQLARQKTVLEAIFFHKSMIPDSPAEPDNEIHPMTDPKLIPLEDASGSKDSIFDNSSTPWPEPKPHIAAEVDTSLPPPSASNPTIPSVVPFSAPGYPSYPTFPVGAPVVAPGPENWMAPDEGNDANRLNFPNGPMAPMYGMPAPYGPPPPNMMPPDGFNMGMFPPNPGFPMAPNPAMFGPGPPMGPMGPPPPGWGNNPWNGPGGPPPMPLDTRNICRSWSKTGNCIRGINCRFLHPGVNCPPLPPS